MGKKENLKSLAADRMSQSPLKNLTSGNAPEVTKARKYERTTVMVDLELYKKFKLIAVERGISITAQLTEIMEEFVNNYRK